jgi:hypothetical protein
MMDDHAVMDPEHWEILNQSKSWTGEDYIHRVVGVMTTTIRMRDGREATIDSTLSQQDMALHPESFIRRISTPVLHRLMSLLVESKHG